MVAITSGTVDMQRSDKQTGRNPEQGHNGNQPLHQAGCTLKTGRDGQQYAEG